MYGVNVSVGSVFCEWQEAFSLVEAFSAHFGKRVDNFLPTKTRCMCMNSKVYIPSKYCFVNSISATEYVFPRVCYVYVYNYKMENPFALVQFYCLL